MINFIIDGQQVQAQPGWTVLDTARACGIHIPTLCYHEAVKPSGVCRLCVVEAREGNWSKVVISCMYPPYEGVEIETDNERVRNVRRWILEMLLAEAPASKEIQALAAEYGVGSTRFQVTDPDEECMLCGLCVRACKEIVGIEAISFASRGITKHIATPYMTPNTACIGCGTCLSVCPTGAIRTRFDQIRGDLSQRTGHGHAH
ncbi:MAG: (2Fe-2S)-binding protein [Deltaproteobacteria bacterium]|nr:(2Fe-2S)-binding protein [Deltaproteobacteria bacterium]